MKSTIYQKLVVFILIIFSSFLFAQYKGGIADGSSQQQITNLSCGLAPGQFAYTGGSNDGGSVNTKIYTSCGYAPGSYAYMGGANDGATVHTMMYGVCPDPPQFYTYYGGSGDGSSVVKLQNCSVVLPVANFTASPLSICVNQSVNFTDTSTNAIAWEWTIPGGTFLSPTNKNSQNPIVRFGAAGTYAVTLKVQNLDGTDTKTVNSYITVIALPPSLTDTTPGSRCGSGSVTLSATPSYGTVNWYSAATGGILLGTGNSWNTPNITTTTTYYAQAVSGTCMSATRTAVTATVTAGPTVTANDVSICGPGNATLTANTTAGTLYWYDVATGGTQLGTGTTYTAAVTGNTTFYVEAQSGPCTTSRIPVNVTVNTVPTITSTTPASRCGAGTATVSATASTGTLNWYTAATGGTFLASGTSYSTNVSATTTFYVSATSPQNCTSARTAVTITVVDLPTITATAPASRCGAGTVTIGATASAGTLSWFAASTGGTALATGSSFTTPSLSSTTTYYVETDNGTCKSARTAVTATVNQVPTITANNTTICGPGSATVSVTTGSGTVTWYDAATGGTVLGTGTSYTANVTSNTTFYAEATENGCTSARIPVTVNVNAVPTITGTTPATRCGTGPATISATASSGTVYWYSAATGGTLLATGNSYTPTVSSTTTFYAAATSAENCTSARSSVTITVTNAPAITSTTPASRCGTGTVTLQAAASAGTVKWYDAATGGTLLGTGTSFTTPSISATTTYYAEADNGGCLSSRTAVTATVNSAPTVTGNSVSICGPGSATVTASASSGTISWFSAATGGTALGTGNSYTATVTSNTTFYAEANNGCTSARIPVTVTVNDIPTITGTTPATRCGAGSATIFATASSGTINWYTAATGGTFLASGSSYTTTVSTTTTFYVSTTSAQSCTSPRTAVTITVTNAPAITSTTPASRCGTGTVTLQAAASAGTVKWYDVATGGTLLGTGTSFTTPSISATTTYYAEADNGGCLSTRTAVTATVNSAPTVTGNSVSICGPGSATVTASANSGTISWFSAATGGTALGTGNSYTATVTSTTTFYAEANNGCTSARIPVTVTVNDIPTITGTTPATRCGAGSATISATASSGTINWYTAATGGTFLASGSSYTATVSTTTTFYVSSTSAQSCTSPRTAVTITVTNAPAISSTTPASRCGTGTVTLQAAASAGTVKWYDAATGGTLLGTGTSFTTPAISATTTYYVEADNGGCVSARTAVNATVNNTAAPTGNSTQDFCPGATLSTLLVNGTAIQWYTAATGGTLLPASTPLVNGTTYYASQTLNSCESSARLAVTVNQGPCLGVQETVKGSLIVYPNPATDFVMVEADCRILKIEIYAASGQLDRSLKVNDSKVRIDMTNMPQATYLFKIFTEKEQKVVKVIKK